MIVFDLKCQHAHVFEAWFADSDNFESQVAKGAIECPICGDTVIEKAPMAPNISAGTGRGRGRSDSENSKSNAIAKAPSSAELGEAIKNLPAKEK